MQDCKPSERNLCVMKAIENIKVVHNVGWPLLQKCLVLEVPKMPL